jgi:hypothetical protein
MALFLTQLFFLACKNACLVTADAMAKWCTALTNAVGFLISGGK